MGRYTLQPEIFGILDTLEPGAGGEVQLTDALIDLNKQQLVLAKEFSGVRYDMGDKIGFIKAITDFAIMRKDLKGDVLEYLGSV